MPTHETKEKIENSALRAFMVFLSLMLQIGWFIWLGLYLRQYYIVLSTAVMMISWVLALHVYSRHMNSAYKLSWIVLILVLPVLGISMYALFGSQLSHVWIRRYMDKKDDVVALHLSDDNTALDALRARDYGLANQCRYLKNRAGYPLYQNTDVTFHNDTAIALADLKNELIKAEKFIFMEYFIIERGQMWNPILDILKRKVKEGVEVRVMYDDVGCFLGIPNDYSKTLENYGIKCVIFNYYI